MVKKLVFSAILFLSLALAACNDSEEADKEETNAETIPANANTKTKDEVEEGISTRAPQEETIEETDEMKITTIYTNNELGISDQTADVKYEINTVQLKIFEPKTQPIATSLGVDIGDKLHTILIEIEAENTSEENMNFYLSQAEVTTNTNEKLFLEYFISDYFTGQFTGLLKEKSVQIYTLETTTFDELESVEIFIKAPVNSDYDTVGEDVKHIIELD